MDALPTDISTEAQPTGIACPDCAGVLEVRAAGRRGFLKFECRIRHTSDLGELLAAKEEQLELRSWSYVVGLEELVALLNDMMASDDRHLESVVARQACADLTRTPRRTSAKISLAVSAPRKPSFLSLARNFREGAAH